MPDEPVLAHRGYRFRVYPTAEQEALFQQFASGVRLVYNLALEQRRDWSRHYERQTGRRLTYESQCKELTALRAAFDWIAAVPVDAQQAALRDLDWAFAYFFAGHAHYPTPRRKGAFRFPSTRRCGELRKLNAKWSTIRLPKIGIVKVRTHRALVGKLRSITVTLEAGKWFASFDCEQAIEVPAENPGRPSASTAAWRGLSRSRPAGGLPYHRCGGRCCADATPHRHEGCAHNVLDICVSLERGGVDIPLEAGRRVELEAVFQAKGKRVARSGGGHT